MGAPRAGPAPPHQRQKGYHRPNGSRIYLMLLEMQRIARSSRRQAARSGRMNERWGTGWGTVVSDDSIDVQVSDAEADPAVKVVALRGSLEARSISAINNVVLPLIEAGNVRLVFDCTGLRYVTSPALGILINYYKKTQSRGGDTKFFGLDENILEIFRIVGLTRTFDIHADEVSAVGAFDR